MPLNSVGKVLSAKSVREEAECPAECPVWEVFGKQVAGCKASVCGAILANRVRRRPPTGRKKMGENARNSQIFRNFAADKCIKTAILN